LSYGVCTYKRLSQWVYDTCIKKKFGHNRHFTIFPTMSSSSGNSYSSDELPQEFTLRKNQILSASKKDKSPIGVWDTAIIELLNYINEQPNFVTTSSCSGRLSLFCSNDKGKGGTWPYKTHEPTSSDVDQVWDAIQSDKHTGPLKLLFEPFLLHLEAATLEDGMEIVKVAKQSGLRESGLLVSDRIMINVRTTALSIRVPIERELVSKSLIRTWVNECHELFQKNAERTIRFFNGLKEYFENETEGDSLTEKTPMWWIVEKKKCKFWKTEAEKRGWYDSARKIRPHGSRMAIPLTHEAEEQDDDPDILRADVVSVVPTSLDDDSCSREQRRRERKKKESRKNAQNVVSSRFRSPHEGHSSPVNRETSRKIARSKSDADLVLERARTLSYRTSSGVKSLAVPDSEVKRHDHKDAQHMNRDNKGSKDTQNKRKRGRSDPLSPPTLEHFENENSHASNQSTKFSDVIEDIDKENCPHNYQTSEMFNKMYEKAKNRKIGIRVPLPCNKFDHTQFVEAQSVEDTISGKNNGRGPFCLSTTKDSQSVERNAEAKITEITTFLQSKTLMNSSIIISGNQRDGSKPAWLVDVLQTKGWKMEAERRKWLDKSRVIGPIPQKEDSTCRINMIPLLDEAIANTEEYAHPQGIIDPPIVYAQPIGAAPIKKRSKETLNTFIEDLLEIGVGKIKGDSTHRLNSLSKESIASELWQQVPKKWETKGKVVLFSPGVYEDWPEQVWERTAIFLKARGIGIKNTIQKCPEDEQDYRRPKVDIKWPHDMDPLVVQDDNGIQYYFDVTQIMFSRGNIKEKLRVARFAASGDIVLDLFAGIGYWAFPIIRHAHAERVVACEWNPVAAECLRMGARINNIEEKITVIEGDNCSEVTQKELERWVFDRVFLGLIPSSERAFPVACQYLRRDRVCHLHVHFNIHEDEEEKVVADIIDKFKKLSGRGVELAHLERVKWYKPRIRHCVIDLRVLPARILSLKSGSLEKK